MKRKTAIFGQIIAKHILFFHKKGIFVNRGLIEYY